MPDYPLRHGGPENGGTVQFFRKLEDQTLRHWDWAPTFMWEARVGFRDLTGSAATQAVDITIPALNFASGRITATFTGYGLGSPVEVVADAAFDDDQDGLATALEAAIAIARAGTLSGVVADETVATNVVSVTFVAGIASGAVSVSYRPAQQADVTLSGTLIDSTYSHTFTGGGLGAPVTVNTVRSGGAPATIALMVAQFETDLEGAAGLSGVLVSADDDTVDTNTLLFEPDVADVTVTTSQDPVSIALQFGGTPTNGNYSTTFTHASLPGGTATVTTVRAAGVPATNAALAVQHESDIELDPRLFGLVASADDDTVDTCIVIGQPGVTGLTASTSAPPPGTLTQTPLVMTVVDSTPAGPIPTVSHSTTVDLGAISGNTTFPTRVLRHTPALEVTGSFGAGRTVTVGDAGDPDGLIGGTPVAIDAVGRSIHVSTDAEYRTQYESAMTPTATIDLGASATLTSGVLFVQVDWSPHGSTTR